MSPLRRLESIHFQDMQNSSWLFINVTSAGTVVPNQQIRSQLAKQPSLSCPSENKQALHHSVLLGNESHPVRKPLLWLAQKKNGYCDLESENVAVNSGVI